MERFNMKIFGYAGTLGICMLSMGQASAETLINPYPPKSTASVAAPVTQIPALLPPAASVPAPLPVTDTLDARSTSLIVPPARTAEKLAKPLLADETDPNLPQNRPVDFTMPHGIRPLAVAPPPPPTLFDDKAEKSPPYARADRSQALPPVPPSVAMPMPISAAREPAVPTPMAMPVESAPARMPAPPSQMVLDNRKDVEALQKQVQGARTALDAMQSDVAAQEKQAAQKDMEIELLKSSLQKAQSNDAVVGRLSAQLSETQKKIEMLQTQAETERAQRMAEIEKQNALRAAPVPPPPVVENTVPKQAVDQLNAELMEAHKKISILQQEVSKSREEAQRQQFTPPAPPSPSPSVASPVPVLVDNSVKKETVDRLDAQLSEAQRKIQDLQQEFEKRRQEDARKEQEIEALRASLARNDHSAQSVQQLGRQLVQAQETISALHQDSKAQVQSEIKSEVERLLREKESQQKQAVVAQRQIPSPQPVAARPSPSQPLRVTSADLIQSRPSPPSAPPVSLMPSPKALNIWTVQRGGDIQAALRGWSDAAGVELVWHPEEAFAVREPLRLQTSYEEAVQSLLDQYAGTGTRPVGSLYIDPQSGKRTLIIQTAKGV
ncbi:MAG: TcpQ domain-containing protein [Alphaproteobacteria bacterium]|nr:TcpQ domain-containing protein [Alphaproteobacteria bacterium]